VYVQSVLVVGNEIEIGAVGWGGVIRSLGVVSFWEEVVFRGTGSLVTGIRYSM